MNAKMPELKRAFEAAGFTRVKTVLSSGNVVFDSRLRSGPQIARKAEAAMHKHLGRTFATIVREVEALRVMLADDPYAPFAVPGNAKRVVTFLRVPRTAGPALPIELEGARILAMKEAEVFTVYVPSPSGPVFMTLIERTLGKDVTTRTWETVKKCAHA